MGWKEAKKAAKEAFRQSTDQLRKKKISPGDAAESARKVAVKVEKLRKKWW